MRFPRHVLVHGFRAPTTNEGSGAERAGGVCENSAWSVASRTYSS